MMIERRVGRGNICSRSYLVKYTSRIWVDPILEKINPFVYCGVNVNPTELKS